VIISTRRGFSMMMSDPVSLSPVAAERDDTSTSETTKAETTDTREDFILQKR
jgi:hypothetical protein